MEPDLLILVASMAAHIALQGGLIVVVLLRRRRAPASRIAWIVVILSLPVIGIISYLLFGETNIGRRYIHRLRQVESELPDAAGIAGAEVAAATIPDCWMPAFQTAASINGFRTVNGNSATLTADSDACIDSMVADIDAAAGHVHLLFYIWLPDGNGRKMAEALMRAALRGVACRALVDDLGSRDLLRSPLWKEMRDAGVRLGRALPIGNPFLRMISGRIDLRNHRKILVIDNRITYCGSQNCADPAFLPKAKFAPWVDMVLRVEGPVALQNQYVFAVDWMTYVDEDIRAVFERCTDRADAQTGGGGFPAQIVATGPTLSHPAMPQMFQSLIYSARNSLFITTPYYAPDGAMQSALCAAGRRGVETTIIFPRRNDDLAVAATSRSYYLELLESGVNVLEYEAGLLHAKSITIDGEITFIGSANMDRRSFDLNFENNMLIWDDAVTAQVRARQAVFASQSRTVSLEEVEKWPWYRRLADNAIGVVSPLL